MLVNKADTVSQALSNGLHYLRVGGIKQPSRVGDVIVSRMPVMTVYQNPLNRVLFSPIRDANPFFHVMEALWMLAGRDDLPWLTQFNKRFASYSDDGGQTQPGAYGYRWRNYFGYDQLETIITELKHNPQTRRAVLAMWDGGTRPTKVGGDLYYNEGLGDLMSAIAGSNDVPCNTHAYFDTIDGKLNMTVCCRSNDILWGAYGANAVHFSFLLEYVAAATGIPMGVYRQFSNNFHMYTNVVAEEHIMPLVRDVEASDRYLTGSYASRTYVQPDLRRVPLVAADEEPLAYTLDTFFQHENVMDPSFSFGVRFMDTVAAPMYRAWQAHKDKDYRTAIEIAETVKAEDWKIACVEWLQRRMLKNDVNKARFTEVADGNS